MTIFWISILAAAIFTFWVFKRGFYEIWILLFNTTIAVYIAIAAKPAVYQMFSSSQQGCGFTNALTIFATAAVVFALLQSICYFAFTSQSTTPFPVIFDTAASVLIGFITGMLICSFAVMLLCITPISQNKFARNIGIINSIDQKNIAFVSNICGIVGNFAGKTNSNITAKTIIENQLFQVSQKQQQPEKVTQPVEAMIETKEEPNMPEPDIKQDDLGPPPEPAVEDF